MSSKKGKSSEDQKRKLEQNEFEKAVRRLRDNKKKIGLLKSLVCFNYGKDPQKKNSDLGKRKVLPKLCSDDLDELKEYIPADIKFNFCILGKSKNNCCYGHYENQYIFDMKYSLDLSKEIAKATLGAAEPKKIAEKAMMEYLVTDKNKDCILKVNGMRFYVKTMTQDSMASAMEPRQNINRMSFAPVVLVPIDSNTLMRLKGQVIGIGYYDLVGHKCKQCGSNEDDACVHRMISIHKDYQMDVYIDFGSKDPNNIQICVEIIHEKLKDDDNGKVTLLVNEPEPQTAPFNTHYGPNHSGPLPASSVRHNPMAALNDNNSCSHPPPVLN